MHLFWGQLTVNKCEKPSELSRLLDPGHGLAPSMKATQYWSLLKYLPLAVGNLVPTRNAHWEFLLHLCMLVDLIYAPRFTRSSVQYLKDVIEDHVTMFSELYGSKWNVQLRPKHHFLVHLPDIVLKLGPLVGMSCMRYELKNAFFKRCAHTVCNFTNICFTLMRQHQQQVQFSLLSSAHIRNAIVVGQQSAISVNMLSFSDILCHQFRVEASDDIAVTNRITVASAQYAKDHCVVIDCAQDGLVFGRIVTFVCNSSGEWHLAVAVLHTHEFCYHFHAFVASDMKPPVYKLLTMNELVDYHPLHCALLTLHNNKLQFIQTPYNIFKLQLFFPHVVMG